VTPTIAGLEAALKRTTVTVYKGFTLLSQIFNSYIIINDKYHGIKGGKEDKMNHTQYETTKFFSLAQ
jgi:hypothetical protein